MDRSEVTNIMSYYYYIKIRLFGRNGQSIPVLLSHCAILVGNLPMADCYQYCALLGCTPQAPLYKSHIDIVLKVSSEKQIIQIDMQCNDSYEYT